jgi:quaternary ammonium compound-resistance protein SugE
MAEVKSLFLSLIRRSLFNLLFLLIFFGECMNIYWGALLIAGLFEIGWPLGLKITALPGMKLWGILLAIVSMALSGALLWFSLRGIPIGTAYAVWTSIGAVGTFAVGVFYFGDPSLPIRWAGVALIILGVVLLKMG